jgi:hypothetical protein
MSEPNQPRNYWADLPLAQFIDGYIRPHIGKAEEEGAHVRALVLEEAARRLDTLSEYETSFRLRWDADMRAIKRWQEAHPGNELTWPDHADLVVWLLERVETETHDVEG